MGLLLEPLNQVDDLRRLLAAAETAGIARESLGSLLALREGRLDEAKGRTHEWESRIQPAAAEDGVRDPAFVVGFPRSGTTLLDTFLMGHPETCVIEEGRMLEFATAVISEAPGKDWAADLVCRARKRYLDELSQYVPPDFTGLDVDKHP